MISVKTVSKETSTTLETNKPAWKSLCQECSTAAKKVGVNKTYTRELLKDIREKNNI